MYSHSREQIEQGSPTAYAFCDQKVETRVTRMVGSSGLIWLGCITTSKQGNGNDYKF